MDIHDVERLLPHRPPILMLDRVVEIEPGIAGVGKRRFEQGDTCFEGHFPNQAILPGVLIIEALAQTLMIVLLAEQVGTDERPLSGPPLGYLARVMEMSFQRPIGPGQEISFAILVEKQLGEFTVASGRVSHEDTLCAKGSLAVAMDRKALDAALGRDT